MSVANPLPSGTHAERLLRPGSLLRVFVDELRPTPGRWQATLRTTVATMVGVVLAAMVGGGAFATCPLAAMTESSPGSVHSPMLLIKRVMASFACAGASILLVMSVPQAPAVLYPCMLLLVWVVMYLARLLPVGSNGLRVAIWTLGPLFARPLNDPTNFEEAGMLGALGVAAGVIIGHAASVLVFPGAETTRARVAVDALLADAAAKLRHLAAACRTKAEVRPEPPPMDEDMLSHMAVLTESIRTYVEPRAGIPELAPLTRVACISDAATAHLTALVSQAGAAPGPREAAARMAARMADLFDRLRGLSFERHWARPGDRVPELDTLAREAEELIGEGDAILREGGDTLDERTMSIAGFARRVGGMLRTSLTDRPLPPQFGTTALALPLGFDPASPVGRAPSMAAALAGFDSAAATSAAAAVCGLGLSLVLAALFLPSESTATAFGAAFVLQSTLGGTGRRGLLRLLGTVLGGIMALVAMGLFAGGLQTLAWYVTILGSFAFVCSWVMVGNPRTSYAGLMMAAAWMTAIVADPQPAASVGPALARILSVLLCGACVTLVVWLFATTTARAALMRTIAQGWRRLAELARSAQMKPVRDGDLADWRRRSHAMSATLASIADLREAYVFERRMAPSAFKPVLRVLAEQQRALLMIRSLATGRFLDHPLPEAASAALDAAVEAQAVRLERLAEVFERPIATTASATIVPEPAQTRAAALAAGCGAEDVARLLYRRDAIAMLGAMIDRDERLCLRGFVWVDGSLESVLATDADEAADARAAMLAATP